MKNLLCILGIHDWSSGYWQTANDSCVYLMCKRCLKRSSDYREPNLHDAKGHYTDGTCSFCGLTQETVISDSVHQQLRQLVGMGLSESADSATNENAP